MFRFFLWQDEEWVHMITVDELELAVFMACNWIRAGQRTMISYKKKSK